MGSNFRYFPLRKSTGVIEKTKKTLSARLIEFVLTERSLEGMLKTVFLGYESSLHPMILEVMFSFFELALDRFPQPFLGLLPWLDLSSEGFPQSPF